MSLHYANVSTLLYDVIMLGQHNYIPFQYANAIILYYSIVIMLYIYIYVCMYIYIYIYIYIYMCVCVCV